MRRVEERSVGTAMLTPPNAKGYRTKENVNEIRNALKDYVNSDAGSVEWQLRHVNNLGPTLN